MSQVTVRAAMEDKGTAFTDAERDALGIRELLPIIYTPTVGEACRQFVRSAMYQAEYSSYVA